MVIMIKQQRQQTYWNIPAAKSKYTTGGLLLCVHMPARNQDGGCVFIKNTGKTGKMKMTSIKDIMNLRMQHVSSNI